MLTVNGFCSVICAAALSTTVYAAPSKCEAKKKTLSAHSSPVPCVESEVVQIAPASGAATSSASLRVIVFSPNPATAQDEKLISAESDLVSASQAPPVVTFIHPAVALPAELTEQTWILPLTVGLMPPAAKLNRYVTLRLGKTDWTLPYQLSSVPPASATWALKPLPVPVRAISSSGAVALNVSVTGALPVTGLKLASIEFIEQGSKRSLAASHLVLCDTPAACVERPNVTVHPPGGQIWLAGRKEKDSSDPPTMWPGKYEGVVTIVSDDKPTGENANLTIYVTDWPWQMLGFALIVVGTFAAWYCTTFLRQRLARDQMLMPVVALRATLDGVVRTVSHLKVPAPTLISKLGEIDRALADDQLELHGLPPAVPQTSAGLTLAPNLDSFKLYFETSAAWMATLQVIVRDGLLRLVERRDAITAASGQLQPAQEKAFTDSIAALDRLAAQATLPSATALATDISTQIAAFEGAMGQVPIVLSSPQSPTRQPRSTEQLRVRITRGSMLAWGFIGVVTAFAGLYVLILSNPGFGTPLDLLGCLLWGLGLPAGTLLASATTGSIASTLNTSR